jgi:3-deoxy-D-manno-octulosonic-acid transferase
LDLPGPCASFLNRIKPRRLLIARTDFWPEMLSQVRRRKIPIEVFSYTQKIVRKGAWLTRFRANLVDRIDCVSTDDLQHLETLKVNPLVKVLGDTRYDQVRYRLDRPKPLPEQLKPKLKCLVAGSTWPEDEKVLLTALRPLLAARQMQLILVPHEPSESHIKSLRSELRYLGISYSVYSNHQPWDEKSVLLVDKIGVLAELYHWGEMAFVGGSFRKTVHSVMEALGAGALTFVGPLHSNNREALEFANVDILGRKALVTARNAEEMHNAVETALAADLKPFRQALISSFNQRLGATERLVEEMFQVPFPN